MLCKLTMTGMTRCCTNFSSR